MPVGPSTIAALPTPSLGHGRAATCTRGRKRRERQFVPKLTLQSTRAPLGFQIQRREHFHIAPPHALQTVLALITEQLEAVTLGVEEIDALGDAVVSGGSDCDVVGFENAVELLELFKAFYLQGYVVKPNLV